MLCATDVVVLAATSGRSFVRFGARGPGTHSDMTVTEQPVPTANGEIELTVSAARDQLADLVNRVAYGRQTIFLTRRGRRMVVLAPVAEPEA